jgi:hypothetical protein
MFSRINNICQNFHVLNPEQKLYWLLNSNMCFSLNLFYLFRNIINLYYISPF